MMQLLCRQKDCWDKMHDVTALLTIIAWGMSAWMQVLLKLFLIF